jgi:hypothetical protein
MGQAGRAWPAGIALVAALAGGCDRSGSGSGTAREATPDHAGSSSLPSAPPRFTDITGPARLRFTHDPGLDGSFYLPQITGPGCGLFDADNDGDLDAYLINGGPLDSPLPNHLFRQESDGSFTDVTEASGLGDRRFGMGLAVADYDNDGDVDVYLTNFGPDQLYRNNGDGTFTNVTAAAGISNPAWSFSASFFD